MKTDHDPGDTDAAASPRPALQSHVAFFDTDGDDIIWPLDTYDAFRGFLAIGFNLLISLFATLVIHAGFSYLTWGTLLPDVFFRIRVSKSQRGIHGSDTGAFTQTGELDEKRFNYVWDLYTAAPHEYMSFGEGVRMIQANRNPFDFFGWFAAAFEWLATYLLLWPEDGRVSKQDVHDVMDGSLFYKLAKKTRDKRDADNASRSYAEVVSDTKRSE
ncbi:unnamed protein product [Mycena citricolor]|uniref:Caleosin-domain-containing protein n=1 Tax=Mycena citricolor TaxID=2018698 RepID=A0AAD2Q441_9AGAR|nr:unnamed protein product [Mycena citricolor]